ncbi:acyl-CoA dehydrogenase family protein [Luminiphilus sp.]|jgi:alkylation response protein AidB-like acyl-CoA dehydrogenase|nr:acyl-CoA dehydrogenase family protein [Luminiphilus sp.]MBT5067116.1 pimeloyl-CoA dehydrogenase large subunit [Halieaceae bacterium]MBT5557041.1 pimeloyl-CoA dehydrogenase large subunit [Halieaceae bacterium]MBT6182008.1 pimeloyl-CoA dehydrogenase large subunit [Halieaceae bacterium]MDA7582422.1 acyl-CoA dehydrogenase family protein [Luminiphilus sp.]
MDIALAAEDLAFRDEVCNFLDTEFDAEMQAHLKSKGTTGMVAWQRKLHAKGWVAPNWPEEHGGTGWTATQKYIWESERSLRGIPDVVPFGLVMVANVIMGFGSDEQKEYFLPRILNSDDWWCQGYSEPGSGSDLASLKTKAERDGDDFIINGAKIWTTYAQHADWIFCLVRTDNSGKKQEGITFILVDMKSEGIKVNPIIGIDNEHNLNEVEFNNVRVPAKNVVGEVGKGWTVAKALLAHERTGIAGVADIKRTMRLIKDAAAKETNGGQRMLDDAGFQQRMADIEVELMALEFTELRTLATMAAGGFPGPESSLLKIKGTELQQATQELRMELAAYYQGVLPTNMDPSVLGHEFGSDARRAFMYGRAATIYGGSNEVQKNIISKYVLGLE